MNFVFRFVFGSIFPLAARHNRGIANSPRPLRISYRVLIAGLRKSLLVCSPIAAVLGLTACGPTQADYQKALDENERLRGEIVKLTAASAGAIDHPATEASSPSLNLNIDDLWAQRFDDNEFRARQRLADKLIRVSGQIGSISEDSITLLGTTEHSGDIPMRVILKDAYAQKMKSALTSLKIGSVISVQGSFEFDRKRLNDAVLVDKKTGEVITDPSAVEQTGSAQK